MLNANADINPSKAAVAEALRPFPNVLSEFVYVRTYSRWIEEEGRRESWEETVDRYVRFVSEERPNVPKHILTAIREAIVNMDVLPSMRALWAAGDAARRDNTTLYNCSFIPLDSLKSFSELLYILMQGTGVGFSVESRFVNNLPEVAALTGETVAHRIVDSTEGWADALYLGLVNWFRGNRMAFDYTGVRPRGAPLKTKGGRASGPEPLMKLLDLCEKTILDASGRKLRPIECHDIACTVGDIVHVGGFRRAALISFSDPEDEEIRHAKEFATCQVCGFITNSLVEHDHLSKAHNLTLDQYQTMYPEAYLGFPAVRFMSNNSAFWDGKPSEEVFWQEWRALVASGSGERGFYMMPPEKRAARRGDFRSNPCGEILLRFAPSVDPWTGAGGGGQFCNLSAAVMRAADTQKTFAEKVRIATWIGVIQSSFTHFPYLRETWRQHCEEDRLLGVDITGHCDNPALSGDEASMLHFNEVARQTAAEAAAWLGVNYPAAITCGKPSGNSSQLVDCASGFHPRYARHYMRRVRIDGKDPLTSLLRDSGMPLFKENGQEHLPDDQVSVWVVEFPVAAPEHARLRDAETALQMLERYLQVMRTWCSDRGHNQSATIYVRDHEWDEVGRWVYEHFNEITGLSFLPYSNSKYRLAPYEEITQAQYEAAMKDLPSIDFSILSIYEQEDRGNGATEFACMSGNCDV